MVRFHSLLAPFFPNSFRMADTNRLTKIVIEPHLEKIIPIVSVAPENFATPYIRGLEKSVPLLNSKGKNTSTKTDNSRRYSPSIPSIVSSFATQFSSKYVYRVATLYNTDTSSVKNNLY